MKFTKLSLIKLYAKGYVFLRKQDTQGKCGRISCYYIKESKDFGRWTSLYKYECSQRRDERFRDFLHNTPFYLTDESDYIDFTVKKLRNAGFTVIEVKPDCLHMISANLFHSSHYFKTNAERNRYIKSKEQEENIIVIQ